MIACFDAKYHYWFWRPFQAIPQADTDGNPQTVADPSWRPLGATPNFPEYPSAHACHSTAVVDGARRVLRHRQGPVHARQPRHQHHPPLRPPPGHRRRRRPGTRPRRLPLPQLRPARVRPRAQGRPLRRRPLLPAVGQRQRHLLEPAAERDDRLRQPDGRAGQLVRSGRRDGERQPASPGRQRPPAHGVDRPRQRAGAGR